MTGSFAVMKADGITKHYANVTANVGVSLDLKAGEIHAVLGENGAGKSTLMKIIYGMEAPDRGHVAIDGKSLDLRSPRDAIDAGIGMVHQHFMLVDNLTVFENLIIGTSIGGRVFACKERRPRAARGRSPTVRHRCRSQRAYFPPVGRRTATRRNIEGVGTWGTNSHS